MTKFWEPKVTRLLHLEVTVLKYILTNFSKILLDHLCFK